MYDIIQIEYLDWLYDLVCDDSYSKRLSYHKLFEKLYTTPFTWTIDLDDNRAEDGRALRYIFGEEYHYGDALIEENLDSNSCSVLEVLIGMAMRCEDAIASDDDYGDRTGQWFWTMVVSMGLGDMGDNTYDEKRANYILKRFLNRTYTDNGLGCPFKVENPKAPMKETDLWLQLNWYLAEVL